MTRCPTAEACAGREAHAPRPQVLPVARNAGIPREHCKAGRHVGLYLEVEDGRLIV